MNAASLNVAELYIAAFQELARTNNTLILPANANDITAMVSQAMATYQTLAKNNTNSMEPAPGKENTAVNSDNLSEYYSDDEDRPRN